MKKTILVTILTVAMLLATIGSVSAASVAANKTEVKAGDTVTVTVNTAAVQGINFDLEFNSDYFEYTKGNYTVGDLATKSDEVHGNVVTIAALDTAKTTTSATVTFTAKKDVEGKDIAFTVKGLDTEPAETIAQPEVKVSVVKAEEKPEEPGNTEDPGNTTNPGNTEKPSNTTPTDINGKPIEKHPATGTPVYVAVIAVIVIAAGAVLAIRKNK